MNNIFRWRNIIQNDKFVDILMKTSKDYRKLRKNVGDLPDVVSIMTKTGCNYKCNFCPNKDITHEPSEMSEELYRKILLELGKDWKGFLLLFIHNEPFLDQRIIKFLEIAKEICPNCTIEVQTNGSVLTKELIEKSLPNLDILKINDYTNDFRVIDRIKEYNIENKKLVLVKRYPQHESLSNRSGNVEYEKMKKGKLPLEKICLIPFQGISIIPDGRVILCCNDWKHEHVFGNVSKQSIKEIWKNEQYQTLRKTLKSKNRNYPLCSKCDYVGFSIGDFRRKHWKLYKFLEGYI